MSLFTSWMHNLSSCSSTLVGTVGQRRSLQSVTTTVSRSHGHSNSSRSISCCLANNSMTTSASTRLSSSSSSWLMSSSLLKQQQQLGHAFYVQQQQQQQQVRGMASKKHKNVLKQTKGYRGRAKNCFSIAVRRLQKAWIYAYRDRKRKKRNYRTLWIMRIQAAVRQYGWRYSQWIPALTQTQIHLNRKVMADMAATEPFAMRSLMRVVEYQQQQQQRQLNQDEQAA